MNLDSFLNVVIPVGIIIFFVGILYSRMKEQVNAFFAWIKGLIQSGAENMPEAKYSEIIYE